jgi:RNA polymerase sigma factor (TIGR02999 family)
MADQPREAVTTLLLRWRQGDKAALDDVVPIVYDELRRVARARLKGQHTNSLQTTALVHEVYLRLVNRDCTTIHDRTHFFALAARLMRQILVDHSRRRLADKRGGGATIVSLDDVTPAARTSEVDVLALDEALEQLNSFDEQLCRVVELKFFAGLNIDEAAEALDVSTATVERNWALAKAWLHQRLSLAADPAPDPETMKGP